MKKLLIFIVIFVSLSLYSQNNFHFAILGDRTGGANQEAFAQVVKNMASLKPDFVVTVGDFAEDGRNESDWDVPLETIQLFDCPIYFTPGNHDIYDENSAKIFKEKTGNDPYYSFNYENTHFIIINNSTVTNYDDMDKEQIEWFEHDLKENQDKENIYIFMHKPFWANAIAEGKEDFMHELYKEYKVDAVFTGHWHQYAYEQIDGIEYFLLGSSGADLSYKDDDMGLFYQFMWCKVEDDQLSTALIKSDNFFEKDLVTIEEEKLFYDIAKKSIISSSEQIESSNEYKVDLEIKNKTEKTISEEIQIEYKENWTVPENMIPVSIEPDDSLKVSFSIKQEGTLFPFPVVKFNYPFGRDKSYKYEKPINIVRTIKSLKVENIPEIDGKIDFHDFGADYVVAQLANGEGQSSMMDTKFFFLNDEQNFYIAFVCREDEIIKSDFTERDEEIYSDDSVGFLISPDGNVVYQFYVNSIGAIWDMKTDFKENIYDSDWNGKFDIKTGIDKNYWLVELSIPLSELGITEDTKDLKINFRRHRVYDSDDAYFIPEWSYKSINQGKMILK